MRFLPAMNCALLMVSSQNWLEAKIVWTPKDSLAKQELFEGTNPTLGWKKVEKFEEGRLIRRQESSNKLEAYMSEELRRLQDSLLRFWTLHWKLSDWSGRFLLQVSRDVVELDLISSVTFLSFQLAPTDTFQVRVMQWFTLKYTLLELLSNLFLYPNTILQKQFREFTASQWTFRVLGLSLDNLVLRDPSTSLLVGTIFTSQTLFLLGVISAKIYLQAEVDWITSYNLPIFTLKSLMLVAPSTSLTKGFRSGAYRFTFLEVTLKLVTPGWQVLKSLSKFKDLGESSRVNTQSIIKLQHRYLHMIAKTIRRLFSSGTVFDKILAKQIPSTKVYEDHDFYAFEDAQPQAPIHILIIPKNKNNLTGISKAQDSDKQILGGLLVTAARIAEMKGMHGYRLVINEGVQGGQSIEHIHLHLMGGRQMKWPPG